MKKILTCIIFCGLPLIASSEYIVKIPLETSNIILNVPSEIKGSANLNPSTINRGESSILSWSYDYANEVNIDGLGVYGKSGSINVSPLATKNYNVTAKYGSISKYENLLLTVIQPNSNIVFNADKLRIGIGQPVNLSWNVENADNINIDNGVGSNLPSSGDLDVYPTIDTTFTLSAKDYNNNDILSSVFVDVVNNTIINSFNASSLNITKGNSVVFNWDVTDSEGLNLNPYGSVSGIPTGSQSITFNTSGSFDFTLESTSLNGTIVSSTPIGINVYNPAVINSYTVNGSSSTIDASPNDTLNFAWDVSDALSYKLNGNNINDTTASLVAASTTGTTQYTLEAFNGAGDVVSKSLSVNVVGLPVINSFTGPTNVFINAPLTLSWTGTGVSKYEIKSNNSSSGIATSATDLGSSLNTNATPTAAGNYTYTLSAYNTANSKVDSTKNITVEANPTFTGFTVNGGTNINVAPSAALTFAGAGFSSGATLQGRDSGNTENATLPATAPATAGTYTYYAAATKSLNSVSRYSAVRNVVVNVINAPVFGAITAPSTVFANAAFTMSYSASNAVNYKIRGNVAASGISTTDVDLGTATTTNITPTAAGTYTYTITATNSVGTTTTTTRNVTVEANPTFTGFTVNGGTNINVSPNTALTFAGAGFSSGATLQGRDSGNTENATLPATAPATAGTYTYYAAATKSLNSVSRYSAVRNVVVNVINAPVFGAITAPSTVFANAAFTMSYSASNAVNYKIRGNVAASGISTTDVDLGTATTTNITPTAAGTYTYTITATNSVGTTTTTTRNVTVEANPTFTGFTVNGGTNINVSPNTALTFAGAGFSSGATLQGRDSGNTENATLPATAPATAGTYTYYAAATKSLNSVSRYSAVRNVVVNVINAPVFGAITAPSTVFANAAFTMSYSASNAVNYKIRGNVAASGISTTDVDLGTATTTNITPTAAGTYTYTITATNSVGTTTTTTRNVTVEANPTFTGFTVNGGTNINVSPNTALTFAGAGFSSGATLQGRDSGNTENATLPATAPATAGTYTYYAAATKSLNSVSRYSAVRNVVVNVINAPVFGAITAPSTVFANAAFTMSYSASNAVNYKIRGNVAASGISTTDVDLGTATSRSITPTAAGTYTYTITATNDVGVTTTTTRSVTVEANPTFTGFTVNGGTNINVSPNTALTFAGAGFSTGATLQGRDSGNTENATLPATAPASAGTYTYYAAATKSLNSVSRYSTVRNVSVNVIAAPVFGAITAPSTVFANAAFTLSYSASDAVNYKIRGNVAASGISTTNVDLGTATTTNITPTAAGTYTYTITATNDVGVTTTTTRSVTVEANPTFTGFTVNGGTNINVSPSTALTFAGAGFSTGATLQGRDSGSTTNVALPATAPATAGTYTYYAAATKSLNSVSRYSALRNVVVNVINAPVFGAITAPSTVFANAAFTLSYSASDAVNYKIRGNVAASGISTTDVDLGTATSRSITPTAAGTYTYTITATNDVGVTTTTTRSVTVEANPTFTGFTVNGGTNINVSPNTALTFAGAGFSTGATLQGRDSGNTENATLPATAPASAGTYTYYAAATKSLNSVSRYSTVRNVSVNVIAAPVFGAITAPSTVFANAAFTLSYSASDAVNYKIRGNVAASGISTTNVDLGTATTTNITPTAAGTYTYTITATNDVGVTTTTTRSVTVEANPTFTGFTVNGGTNINVSPSTALTFAGAGFSTGATLQGRDSGSTTNVALPATAPATAGTYTYYAAATKSLNSVSRYSALRNVVVNVINAPVFGAITAPSTVFANAAFTLSYSASDAVNYKIRGNVAASGISTTDVDLGTATSKSITPTAAGTYTYTITATNDVGVTTTTTRSVTVEANPTFTGFTVNGGTNINVSPNTALTFAGAGFSTGATLQGRDSGNTENATLPATAPASAGTYTYYAAATKSLNSVSRYSTVRNVSVNVIAAPVFGAITAPSTVFANAAFTLSYSASDAVNYKIRGNVAASGISTTNVDLGTATTTNITPTAAGTYTYTITATNDVGVTTTTTRSVTVEANPTFTGFTVNGGTNINVSPSTALTFAGAGFSTGATLQGRDSGSTTNVALPATAPATAGTYTYYAAATKSLNSVSRYSALRNVVVNVINAPVFGAITAPSTVFANAAFTLSYSASDAVNYKIRGNVAASGISTTDVDLGTATSRSITPTAAGTYTYTITATNDVGVTTTTTRSVTVEANPTFTGFTVNGGTNINVSPNTALTFAGAGFSTGATLQGRDSGNTENATLPATAPASAGTYTYYAAATKSLNSVSRYSTVRNVSVNVIAAPVFGAITAPSTVFANAAFTLSYSASDAVNYKIRGNVAASGISTTNVDLGTATTTNITPTAAGTYTYTITATNDVGVTTTTTRSVTVEANPTFTGFTVNGGTNINVSPSTALTFAGAGFSTGATLQGRDSGSTTNVALPATAPATAGTYTYYAAATKSLNSVSRYSALRNVVVNVINAPVFGAITAPSTVFANAAFTLSYSASDAVNYKIRGNVAASGISTTDVDLGTATSRSITPTAAGTYTYTITATNDVGVTTTTTRSVTVEANPTFTGFTVNGGTNINVSPNTALTFAGAGFSTGATLQGRDSGNTENATLPATAPASAGTYTYYAAATKSLNSVSRYSTVRNVSVNVIAAPVFGAITAPSTVFANAAFTLSYSASDAVNYKIRGNVAASGISTTNVDLGTATTTNITPTAAGTYTYTITATNDVGVTTTTTRSVTVEANPTFTGFTVNGGTNINVSPSTALTFAGAGFSTGATLQGRDSGSTTNVALPATAPATAGTYTYYAAATKSLNSVSRYSALRNVVVNVINAPVFGAITAPSTVFANAAFTLSYSASDAVNYKIRGNVAASGISTTDVDLGTATSRSITPTAAGTYTYTITATNDVGVTTTTTRSVTVEANPTFTGFTVNGGTNINVSPNTALTFAGAGFSTGATLQGRDSGNTENATLPATAPASAGTYTYYAAATKSLNSVSRYSTVRNVSVNVIAAPVFGAITAPSTVFANAAFTLSYSASDAVNYKIRGNVAASGISTTNVDLGTATTTNITPTAAGTYTYTITATNDVGVTTTTTRSVTVEANPTFTGFTVNGGTNINVSPSTALTFAGAGFSTGATLQGRDSGSTTNVALPATAPATAGTYTYYAAATKSLNSVSRYSALRNVVVNVINAPVFGAITAPSTVFANAAFTLSYSASDAVNYKIRGNVAASGISTTDVDLGTATSRSITPTAAGTYTYTITATNDVGVTTTTTRSVTVEANPTFTGFTVNGGTNINVSPNTALTFAGAGFSTGATLQGRDSGNTENATLPATAPASAGTYTYYAAATKSLNSVSRYSTVRNVSVNVIAAPVFGAITAPSTVFANAAFTLSYSASDAVNYKIRGNVAASGISTTNVDLGTATTTNITPTAAGTYTYTITATNDVGVTTTTTRSVTVEANPTFTGFTVNGGTNINVSPSTALTFAGAGFSTGATLQGRDSGSTTNVALPATAPATAGTYTYYAAATKSLNSVSRYSALRNVVVNVINAPVFGAITAPSTVFANAAFTLSYSASDAVNYKIRGNVAASGISTTDVDLGTATSRSITPTAAGTYTYTITATNDVGVTTTTTRSVTVEANPTFTGFTVNGGTNINVSPNTALTFAGAGFSTGATLQGRDSGNTENATLPATAPASAGTYTYYAAATKSLNSVSRYSTVRNVSVNVIAAPVFGAITAPSTVFANAAFTLSYSASDAVNYKIRGNVAASGISTTNVDLGTATTTNITPTAAGTYTYTITATNDVGVTTTTTRSVTVEANPTFTGFTVNGGTNINVSPSTALTFAGAGFSTGATLQGRDSGSTTNVALPATAPATAGTYTYYAAATKSLNSVSRYSALRNVVVNVINAPVFGAITAPSTVFANAAFTLSYSASDAVNYKIRGNVAASGISTTDVDLGTATSRSITPTAAGTYTYTITATNDVGVTTTTTRSVTVEANPTFTGFTVNGGTNINVSPNTALTFAGAGFSTGATLQGRDSGNTENATLPATAPASAGTYTYYAAATKSLNSVSRYSTVRNVSVNVIAAPVFGAITAPSTVFANAAFTLSYSASDAVNYKIRGNVAASGISTTNVDLGTATTTNITPTAAGTYTYTITATNDVGVTTTTTRSVTVEANPTFTGFTVNGGTNINVSPSTALTFAGAGFSTGATLQGRDSGSTTNVALPATAPATAGTYTYYAAATKSLNSVSRYSALRNVVVNVINAPVFGAITAPSTVFANAAFTLSYSASDAVNYKIRGNVAASGLSTTDVDLGTATTTNITPTAAGTYTYTITATNDVGVTTTTTRSVTVEANPTFTGFTVNGGTNINVAPSATLTFAGAGFSSGSSLQGRNSGNTENATLPATAPATAGTYTYYAAATKSLNSVSRYSTVRNVSVNVIAAPVFGTVTAPSNVFANAEFTISYSASNAVNYKIRGNVAASGISTTNVDLGTATTTNITPTAAGTYTYTLTATNSAGTTTTTTINVTVVAGPSCKVVSTSERWDYRVVGGCSPNGIPSNIAAYLDVTINGVKYSGVTSATYVGNQFGPCSSIQSAVTNKTLFVGDSYTVNSKTVEIKASNQICY